MSKICKEVAEQELKRFCDMMDINFENEDGETTDELKSAKSTIVKAVMNGSLVFNDEGLPTFTPRRTKDIEPITFQEATGATLISMETKKGGSMRGLMEAMSQLSGNPATDFAKLKSKDLMVCLALVNFLLMD
jgi:hypothetical protein